MNSIEILNNKAPLTPLKTNKNRLLGLDVGDKTIGVSLSDLLWSLASPHLLIKRKNNISDLKEIEKICYDYNVTAIIIGYPLNMNGTEGPQSLKVRELSEKLLTLVTIPIYLWDERLSTVAVTKTLLEADMSRKKRSQVVDKMAATFILQGVLDFLRL